MKLRSDKKAMLNDPNDLLVMFLPNFSMLTPFHMLLNRNRLALFNESALKISDTMFAEFFRNNAMLSKIRDMFIFALEHVFSFELAAIDMFYCRLELNMDEKSKDFRITKENCEKMQCFLRQIRDYILKEPLFINHKYILSG